MFNRASLKQEVKNIIKGKRIKIFMVRFLIMLLISLAVFVTQSISSVLSSAADGGSGFMSLISMLISLVIVYPLTLGLYRYYQRVWRQTEHGMSDVFDIYRNFGVSVTSMIWKSFWMGLWGVLFVFTIALLSGMTVGVMSVNLLMDSPSGILQDNNQLINAMMNHPKIRMMIIGASMITYVLSFMLLMIKSISYSQMEFIVVEHPELGAMRSLNASKRLMKGHKWEYFKLMMSFLPWMFLSVLAALPACFVTFAYFSQSHAWSSMFGAGQIAWSWTPTLSLGLVVVVDILTFVVSIALSIYIAPYIFITQAGYYDKIKAITLDSRRLSPMEFGEGSPSSQAVWTQDTDDQQNQPPFVPPSL